MIHVLLVEDNRADARLLEEHLRDVREFSFELTKVETLHDGIAVAARHDVILLDLSLPDALGLDTLTQMLAAARAVPIIVLTGTHDDRTALDAVAAGAQDYLLKDELTPSLVVKTIRYAIERKRLQVLEVERAKTTEALTRARFVAEVTAAASSSLEPDAAMRAVAALVVPTLGDACAIDLLTAAGACERVAASPGEVDVSADVIARAIDTRASVAEPKLLVTPLIARDRVVAVISYVLAGSARSYGTDEQVLATELAARVALAFDNARLFADAQRALHGRDELLAIVSHDLRNPLGVVDLSLRLIARDPSHLQAALPRAQRAVDRMKTLIEDLLEVSRIDAGKLEVTPVPTELAPLLADVLEQHRMLAEQKQLKLVGELAPDLGMIVVDPARLMQALGNLLGNAIKFTPPGGAIRLAGHRERDAVTLRVHDTGPGMPSDMLAHVFDRFWQAPGRRRREGVGLGLAIVKGIVDAHRGVVRVDSEVGHGTTFALALPARSARGPADQAP